MTENKGTPRPDSESTDEKDVEGHNMWLGPNVAADLARSRSKEVEREARDRKHAKEARER